VPFNDRIVGYLSDGWNFGEAIGGEQPNRKSRMQSHSFQIQFQRLAVYVKCVHSIAVRCQVVRCVPFRFAAQIANVKPSIAI